MQWNTVCWTRYVADCTEGASTSCQMDVHGATQETLGWMRAGMTLFDARLIQKDNQIVILNCSVFYHSSEDPLLLLFKPSLHIMIVFFFLFKM